MVVAVRDDHKGIQGFSVVCFSPFLNLVKQFRIKFFSDKSCFFSFSLFFSYDAGHIDSRLTHGEIYYEYNDLDTLQMPTWAYDVALEHRRNRRGGMSDDIGVGGLNRSCDGTDSEPRQGMVGHLTFTDFLLPCSSKALT